MVKAADLVDMYSAKLALNMDMMEMYSTLLFALQLPGICARYEFPPDPHNKGKDTEFKKFLYKSNGTPLDKRLYIEWFVHHSNKFARWLFGNASADDLGAALYALRSKMIHTGVVLEKSIKLDGLVIVFVDRNERSIFGSSLFFLSYFEFCELVFSISKDVFTEHDVSFSSFDDIFIPKATYDSISGEMMAMSYAFWRNFSESDNTLYMVYNHMFRNSDFRIEAAKKFFESHPGDTYVVDLLDFTIYGCHWIPGTDGDIIRTRLCEHIAFSEPIEAQCVCLTLDKFERMLEVKDAIDNNFVKIEATVIDKYFGQ